MGHGCHFTLRRERAGRFGIALVFAMEWARFRGESRTMMANQIRTVEKVSMNKNKTPTMTQRVTDGTRSSVLADEKVAQRSFQRMRPIIATNELFRTVVEWPLEEMLCSRSSGDYLGGGLQFRS